LAQEAYRIGLNSIGHTFSVAASLPRDGAMRCEYYDNLQRKYRAWLISGFAGFGWGEI
jgi:hypothetical protein